MKKDKAFKLGLSGQHFQKWLVIRDKEFSVHNLRYQKKRVGMLWNAMFLKALHTGYPNTEADKYHFLEVVLSTSNRIPKRVMCDHFLLKPLHAWQLTFCTKTCVTHSIIPSSKPNAFPPFCLYSEVTRLQRYNCVSSKGFLPQRSEDIDESWQPSSVWKSWTCPHSQKKIRRYKDCQHHTEWRRALLSSTQQPKDWQDPCIRETARYNWVNERKMSPYIIFSIRLVPQVV